MYRPIPGKIDTTYVKELASRNKYKFNVSITYNKDGSEKTRESLAKNVVSEGLKVDTITVKEDFEFPTSYKNMRFSYPVLYIEGAASKSDVQPKVTADNPNPPHFVYDLVIDKIILKRKN